MATEYGSVRKIIGPTRACFAEAILDSIHIET